MHVEGVNTCAVTFRSTFSCSHAVPRTDFDSRKFSEAGAGECEATPVFSQPQVKMYKVGCCFSFLEIRVEEEKISVGLGSFREK